MNDLPTSESQQLSDPTKIPSRNGDATDGPDERNGTVAESSPQQRIALDENDDEGSAASGLAQLVLTLVKLLHDLLEKQAIQRMESESLTEEEVERIGRTLMKQKKELERICEEFGLELDDLHLLDDALGELVNSPM